jgi:hypothetical protein
MHASSAAPFHLGPWEEYLHDFPDPESLLSLLAGQAIDFSSIGSGASAIASAAGVEEGIGIEDLATGERAGGWRVRHG